MEMGHNVLSDHDVIRLCKLNKDLDRQFPVAGPTIQQIRQTHEKELSLSHRSRKVVRENN